MKKTISIVALTAILFTACAQSQIHFADSVDVEKALSESKTPAATVADDENRVDLNDLVFTAIQPEDADEAEKETPEAPQESDAAEAATQMAEPEPTAAEMQTDDSEEIETALEAIPAAETVSEPEAVPQPAAESAPVSVPTPAYGAIPFSVAAGTDKWWAIDSSDSAYWAMQEQINAVRAAGGLPALAMDGGLSAIASSRCESFVSGGPFDHSGMVTVSEICAAGPLGSASAACDAWVASADHYANIMRTDITTMGVGCWFCDYEGNQYTYWVVTFE